MSPPRATADYCLQPRMKQAYRRHREGRRPFSAHAHFARRPPLPRHQFVALPLFTSAFVPAPQERLIAAIHASRRLIRPAATAEQPLAPPPPCLFQHHSVAAPVHAKPPVTPRSPGLPPSLQAGNSVLLPLRMRWRLSRRGACIAATLIPHHEEYYVNKNVTAPVSLRRRHPRHCILLRRFALR